VVAALVTPGSSVTLRGVGLNPTRTGLLDALLEMGAGIEILNPGEQAGEPVGDLVVEYSRLSGIHVSGERVVRMIDEFPVFAVAAACAEGETLVSEAVELRHKESDRISALCGELKAVGVDITERPDGFLVRGGAPLSGGTISPHGDHRLAMSLAVAGLAAHGPVTVNDAGIIHESFPRFAPILEALGAQLKTDGES
jgi:3-phosphoshikimate 1-carboxyvinyltransferase